MDLSCSFPPGPNVVEWARLAERLGYRRVWLYDSPVLYPDVWMTLDRVAAATARIGRGGILGIDLAGEIGDRHAHLRATEVDGDDEGGIAHQFVGDGGATDMAAGAPGLLHPALLFQPADDLRNGLLGKAGLLRDRRARNRTALDDRLHDGALGELPGDAQAVVHGDLF